MTDETAQAREVAALLGRQVRGDDGSAIGRIGQVYLDDTTGKPQWISVGTGTVSAAETYVPLHGSRLEGEDLVLPFSSDVVSEAPVVRAEQGRLSEDSRQRVADHYGVPVAAVWDGADAVAADPDETVERGGELSFGTGIGGTQTGRAGISSSAGTASLRERAVDPQPGDVDLRDAQDLFAVSESGEHIPIRLDEFGSPVVDDRGR